MNLKEKSIKEIKAWLEEKEYELSQEEAHHLEKDQRNGIKVLLDRVVRNQIQKQKQIDLWNEMTCYEQELRSSGAQYIAGVDEVGRGPLAGPVVSAAVVLPADFYLLGLNDSKQLTKDERAFFYQEITTKALAVSISFVSERVIDQINILNATKQSMIEAIHKLNHPIDSLLIDAVHLDIEIPQISIIGGDRKSISIAAASIVAKEARDQWMSKIAEKYPQYGFERNMGYGTKEHLEAIEKFGVTPIHRKSFAGVKEWVEAEKVGS